MADAGWALTSLYHTVVNVRDLDKSVAFYRLLGFEVLNDRRQVVWPDFVASIFGMRRAKGRRRADGAAVRSERPDDRPDRLGGARRRCFRDPVRQAERSRGSSLSGPAMCTRPTPS